MESAKERKGIFLPAWAFIIYSAVLITGTYAVTTRLLPPDCSDCTSELDAVKTELDRLQEEYDGLPGFVTSSVDSVDQSTAQTQMAYFKRWSESKEDTLVRAMNLDIPTLTGITMEMRRDGIGKYGVRAYYGFTEPVEGEFPSDDKVRLFIMPLDANGDELELPGDSHVYFTALKEGFARPCPKYCD